MKRVRSTYWSLALLLGIALSTVSLTELKAGPSKDDCKGTPEHDGTSTNCKRYGQGCWRDCGFLEFDLF